jgi:glycosyltransferase involved in cell wall biosynthesis
MGSKLFSVIIPTFNRAQTIGGTIRSVLDQTESNFELIIVDDGSTDDTKEIVSKFLGDSRLQYVQQPNSERAAARNHGYRVSTGHNMNFLDSDDVMLPFHLQRAKEFIRANSDVDFFHTCYEVVNESGSLLFQELGEPESNISNRLIETNYLTCNSVFVSRHFFGENLFNEDRDLSSSEDWELWLRLISRKQLARCEHVTFQMLDHSERSLYTISLDNIVKRDTKLLKYLLQDSMFTMKFAGSLAIFEADRYTFFALLYSLRGDGKREALHYLKRAFLATPGVMYRRRFWAALKHVCLRKV